MVKQEAHRPGSFKQANKMHKTGRHRSKGSISSDARGKLSVKTISKKMKKMLNKEARRHQAQQIRSKKREESFQKKRNLIGSQAPPILIAIVPLHEDLNVDKIVTLLTNFEDQSVVSVSNCGSTHISIPRFKQRFSIVIPPLNDADNRMDTLAILDLVKVATTVLFISSAINHTDKSQKNEVLDSWGENIMQMLTTQGLPTPILAVTDLERLPIKKRQDYKQHMQKTLHKWLPDEKVMGLDSTADALNVLRRAGSQKQRNVTYRNKRSYLLAENVHFTLENEESNFGTLQVSGYLRGMPLAVNGLVHITGFGDYQMKRIDAPRDPYPLNKGNSGHEEMEEEIKVLQVADPNKQESLQAENIPDPMDAEQTWPTEQELAEAEQQRKIVKRVPKGTSEYQAAWIPDEDGEDYSEEDSDGEDESMDEDNKAVEEENSEGEGEGDKEEYETVTISEAPNDQRYDEQMDVLEENEAMKKFKEAKLDAQFPDEVDTPQNILAKERFQKYRGLESFRTSPWDVKENLPLDYARIYQFENFDRTRRRIFKEREALDGAMPGWYVTIHITGVSSELYESYQSQHHHPLTVYGLLENEHKMSVLNFVLKRTFGSQKPIKSKEKLIFQCGFRRFSANPIFSQHTNGTKHKYERYFQPHSTVVATTFAPITFPPCPVICFTENKRHGLELIATGSLLSVSPDRLIIKRVVLSGHPFKVNKKSAVIRFMFFYREDIKWFAPVKLHTKYGRRGHIKEPLGTHGHMKCVFDGQLKSQDTILMNLYKRVFPKWTYEPLLLTDALLNVKTIPSCDHSMENN